jgi:hypothetical protein
VYDLVVHKAAEVTAPPLIEKNVFLVEKTRRALLPQRARPILCGPDSEVADNPQVVATFLGACAEPPGKTPQA